MIDVIMHGESQTLALQQLGHQPDSIGPAVGVERAVVDCFDNLGKGLKWNFRRLDASGCTHFLRCLNGWGGTLEQLHELSLLGGAGLIVNVLEVGLRSSLADSEYLSRFFDT